jgi:thiol-disulfide isomerase/thioredoxin
MNVKLIGITVLLALVLPLSAHAEENIGPEIGQPSPNIVGRTLDDQSYRLKSDKGSPKVINFFWVKCVPCKKEMPELAEMEKQNPKVKFISVHTQKESPEVVEKFVKSLSAAPSNIVLTTGGIQETFQYLGLPHTIVLDSDNIVLMNLVGYTPGNMQKLSEALQQIAKQ